MSNLKKNFFGTNYPTDNHDLLIEMFSINKSEFVLDVGGGHSPFIRANVVVEIDLSEGRQRDGKELACEKGNKFIAAVAIQTVEIEKCWSIPAFAYF